MTGLFEPVIVPERERRPHGVDQIVLTVRGLTTGEIVAHVGEVYGAKGLARDTITPDR